MTSLGTEIFASSYRVSTDSTKETCAAVATVCYYEEQGLLQTRRDSNCYWIYADDAVTTVLAAGLTTEVIRTVLPCASGDGLELELCPKTRGALAAYVPTM
jgi:DNA-binding transcriptional MerR regulator